MLQFMWGEKEIKTRRFWPAAPVTVLSSAAVSAERVPNCGSLQIHFFTFFENSLTPAASCTGGMIMFVPSLQDFSSYELMACFTLYPKLNLVVPLTVGNAILADIFPAQHFPAGFALEAAEVPLAAQR